MEIKQIIKSIALVLLFGSLFAGCTNKFLDMKSGQAQVPAPTPITAGEGENEITYTPGYQFYPPQNGEPIAIVKTNMGDIKIKLFPDKAPKAVENFTTHAKNGYYDNLIFHRVINDFMIQGGDPLGNGTDGESFWGTPFEDEFTLDLFNYGGALSMANSGENTNGSQFFIVQKKTITDDEVTAIQQGGYPEDLVKLYQEHGGTPGLDFRHTVFGQVYTGMDVVDKIAAVKTGKKDKPVEDVIIKTIEIKESGKD